MKQINRVLSTFLAFVFVLSAVMACPITAKAYNYTIKITLAASSDEKAEFIPLEEMISSKALNISNGEAAINGETLTLTGLNYGDKVTFNPQAAITIGADSKYYVKGMRVAGTNNVLAAGAFDVFEDQTYVIAYGVGDIVPYVVHYVDMDGKELLDAVTYYSAADEAVYIPYKHVDGYAPVKAFCNYDDKLVYDYPNAYNIPVKHLPKLDENGKPAEYTFQYSKGGETQVVTTEVEIVETSTSYGAPIYNFQSRQQSSRLTNGTTNIIRRNAGNNGADQNSTDTDNQDNSDDSDDSNVGVDNQSIEDTETPTGNDGLVEIDDDATAKSGGAKDTFIRNMIIGIILALIALAVIIIALVIANKKKKKKEKNDSEQKSVS